MAAKGGAGGSKPGKRMAAASLANLAKGGGKKGRSGRKPKEFTQLARQLLDEDVEVQSEFEAALKDRTAKGYVGAVRLAAQLAGKLKEDETRVAGQTFVVLVPAMPGAVDEWMRSFAPPEAQQLAGEIASSGGRALDTIPEAELNLAPPEE